MGLSLVLVCALIVAVASLIFSLFGEFTTVLQDNNGGEIMICLKHSGAPPSVEKAIFLISVL
jgi:hypothetical protein